MLNVQALLSVGLVSTIVPLEILGVINLATPLNQPTAIAAPRRPIGRVAGGKRGLCQTAQAQPTERFTALLPASNGTSDLTATKAPTFYFYVPDDPKDIASLEFRLAYDSGDRQGTGVINPPLKVSVKTPGVVKVQLPEILEKDTRYRWSFTLRCQKSREVTPIQGTILYQELDATVKARLAQATSAQDKAKIYAQQNILLDAIAETLSTAQLQGKSFDAIAAEIEF